MPAIISRRHFVWLGAVSLLEVGASGCGTVLHPERRGQAAGDIDWAVFALDAVGLLFFFVPGVIAFAVDFNNGSIYLPAGGGKAQAAGKQAAQRNLVRVHMRRDQLTQSAIE